MTEPLPVTPLTPADAADPRSPTATPAPLTLAYDDLPPGSDIRREYRDDGSILITVPGAEVPQAIRRAAMQAGAVSGSILSIAFLTVALAVFAMFVRNNRISGVPLQWAIAFFAIFCLAVVALVAWVRYRIGYETLEVARRQSTVLAVSPNRLAAETSGPFGSAGYDLPRQRIASLEIRRSWLLDSRGQRRRLPHLELVLASGRSVALLPGRDEIELRWIAGAIRQRLLEGRER